MERNLQHVMGELPRDSTTCGSGEGNVQLFLKVQASRRPQAESQLGGARWASETRDAALQPWLVQSCGESGAGLGWAGLGWAEWALTSSSLLAQTDPHFPSRVNFASFGGPNFFMSWKVSRACGGDPRRRRVSIL